MWPAAINAKFLGLLVGGIDMFFHFGDECRVSRLIPFAECR